MQRSTLSKETLKRLLALNFLWYLADKVRNYWHQFHKKVNAEENKRLEEKSKQGPTSIVLVLFSVLGLFFGKGRILTGRTRPVELLSKHLFRFLYLPMATIGHADENKLCPPVWKLLSCCYCCVLWILAIGWLHSYAARWTHLLTCASNSLTQRCKIHDKISVGEVV